MSNKIVNLVDQSRIGDVYAKTVLRKIADQSNDAGSGVWSSHGYIAWCTEIGQSTVAKKCVELREMGILNWERRPGSTNLYTLSVDEIVKRIPDEGYHGRLMENILEGTSQVDMSDDEVSTSEIGVSTSEIGDTHQRDTSLLSSPKEPELERDVILPNGEPVAPEYICVHCGKAPKAKKSKAAKYCRECAQLGKCQRCGENKIAFGARELCAKCKEVIDPMFKHMAYRSFKSRAPSVHLGFQQVEAIVNTVGDNVRTQQAWALWLDYWKASNYKMFAGSVGRILQAFVENRIEYLGKVPGTTSTTPSTFTKYMPPRKED